MITSKGPPSYHRQLADPEADPDLKWWTFELRPEPSGEPAASEDEDKPDPDEEPAGLQEILNNKPVKQASSQQTRQPVSQ